MRILLPPDWQVPDLRADPILGHCPEAGAGRQASAEGQSEAALGTAVGQETTAVE
ncbi:MAG: hypothetical protein L0215_21750 [Gemmataceae bacterium]|nr:hypothetical protein [Gemmataceae bacterium]